MNRNVDSDTLNILDYLYYYNGAGVAAGDINNDGLPDLYFASNQYGNKLYLNKGNFQFEDITAKAGVQGSADWTTGVSMADVNGDGYLDIYVCAVVNHKPSGQNKGEAATFFRKGRNQLFINNGDGTFTEQAEKWNVAEAGYSTQAVFFDYDRDGDLDMFLLQHSIHQTDSYGDTSLRRKHSDISGGKLFRNDGSYFTDVTAGSGIYSSALGYGLGVAVSDFNHDGWDDIYVGNDFHENDYYYMNQGNGTFKEMNASAFGHESNFSMGNDAADINNDGWIDLVTLDMLPENEKVLKSSLGEGAYDEYGLQRQLGYHYQYARNALQLNIGKGKRFSEIGLYSNIAATDWSWSALIADYDLDGYKDIFITNGIKRRLNDLDYIRFISSAVARQAGTGRQNDLALLEKMPEGKWHNYFFRGNDSLRFTDVSEQWGMKEPNLSSGAVYVDLDGDGDLDLVTNNINEAAGIYENTIAGTEGHNHLSVRLAGMNKNTFGIGAKVFAFAKGNLYFQEMQPSRGFLSSVDPVLNFGLGAASQVDSIVILWPDKKMQRIINVKSNQTILVKQKDAMDILIDDSSFIYHLLHVLPEGLLTNYTDSIHFPHEHKEDVSFVDFNSQSFIPHFLSTEGPHVVVADVNKDGLEDVFYCGAKGYPGKLLLQQPGNKFISSNDSLFAKDAASEDVDALFFDADNDGDMDLYVVSGGNEYSGQANELKDRLYINRGNGTFYKSSGLPAMYENKSTVCAADINHDGYMDLFVGGRADAQDYGILPTSYILMNDGKGNFSVATKEIAPDIEKIGMVTSACFTDIDQDGWQDLVIVGEWMAPTIFKNVKGKLILQKQEQLSKLTGWWHCVKAADFNGDGFPDLLLGNYGQNSKLRASTDYPVKMYVKDVDYNGRIDQILCTAKEGFYYPFLNKEQLEARLPYLKKQFLSYSAMAGKTTNEIFGDRLDNAILYKASEFKTCLLLNNGKGAFKMSRLPECLQWSSVFAFYTDDFNKDGRMDFIAGGNFYGVNPYEGRYDALLPNTYLGNGKGGFQVRFPISDDLLKIEGEIRDIKAITIGNRKMLIVARNNKPPAFLRLAR